MFNIVVMLSLVDKFGERDVFGIMYLTASSLTQLGKERNSTNTHHDEWTISMRSESVLSGGSLTSSHIEISTANSLSILVGSKALVGVCLVLVHIDNLQQWSHYIYGE